MKLLYIGHYKEGTGWSKAAIDTILAANSSDIDVVCRNIKLTNFNPPPHPVIFNLESKSLNDVDYCIQHVLPHHMVGTQKFKKNIGYFDGESSTLKYNSWIDPLKLMDEVWVPNTDLKNKLVINDGFIDSKVKVIPHASDLNKYTSELSKINFHRYNHTFKFYYIGEINDRKNLESIIRCFHSEFENYEPVSLVLKVKKFGVDASALEQYVNKLCNSVKSQLRMYKDVSNYHGEIIIASNIPDNQIDILHNTCDCFVGPSHGEAWSIPAFEAMAFGKTPICSNEGGPKDFIGDIHTGCLINGVYDVCDHSDPAFPEIFTGREEWFHPSESEIKKAMRFYYENRNNIDRSAGLEQAQRFSYKSVGQMIKDTLNA